MDAETDRAPGAVGFFVADPYGTVVAICGEILKAGQRRDFLGLMGEGLFDTVPKVER